MAFLDYLEKRGDVLVSYNKKHWDMYAMAEARCPVVLP
jgi:hypothetical protein